MRIQKISLHRLKIPLAEPYRLAFGVVHAFDTIVVELYDQDGAQGLGEATLLTGYTDETIEDSWQLAGRVAQQVVGADFGVAREKIDALCADAPFTMTAFVTALEMIEGHPALQVVQRERVPLLGLVHGTGEAALRAAIELAIGQGYDTLKVKVGFDVEADLKQVALVQRILDGRRRIRLDANQGYSREEAVRFVTRLEPGGIELFEQPCAAGDWDGACAVARVSPVPMMLDESIFGIADIERAAELKAAAFIKLKLMKMGGLSRLADGLRVIRELGMEPVLGNGVATDIGCWMEACVARGLIRNDGEMNGGLKSRLRLLSNPPLVRDGAMILEPGYRPSLNREAIRECLQAHGMYEA
jgi:L-alanine-DL-glutamate epimerase-like enolase superfamily enzyme